MRKAWLLAIVLLSACAHTGPAPDRAIPAGADSGAGPDATTPGVRAPGVTEPTVASNEVQNHCDANDPQPELLDMSSALATQQSALISCMSVAGTTEMHVTFVVDIHGRARDVTVNGATQGGAARCIRRTLRRVSLRGRSECPTTGEFVIAGLPGRQRGATGRAWQSRMRR